MRKRGMGIGGGSGESLYSVFVTEFFPIFAESIQGGKQAKAG
jgi:hypothetical protein